MLFMCNPHHTTPVIGYRSRFSHQSSINHDQEEVVSQLYKPHLYLQRIEVWFVELWGPSPSNLLFAPHHTTG
jgi:hypothetical protein